MKKDHLCWILLLSLFAFHLISNMVILFRDTTPFIADASVYYKLGFRYWKTWTDIAQSGDLHLLAPILDMGLGGELLALVVTPFFSVFGVSHDTAILANQSFFLILILSIFGLGKILFNRRTGLLAAFLISFYPGVTGFSRVYMLEFPALAISTACVYLLIRAEGFKKFKYSLCFGFAFALGELIRPRFVIYVAIPVLVYMIKNLLILLRQAEVPEPLSAKRMAINALSSAVLSCLLLLPWYSPRNISQYLSIQDAWISMPALSNVGSTLPYYLQMLLKVNLGPFFTALFFLGPVLSLFEKHKRSKIYFLLAWFALTLVLVSMFGLTEFVRLVIPLLAPVALLSAAGLEELSARKIGKYFLVVLLFFGVFQYFLISYGDPRVDKRNERRRLEDISLLHGLLQAKSHDWALDKIMSVFEARRNSDEAWGWEFINNSVGFLIGNPSLEKKDVIRVLDVDWRGTPINNGMEENILTSDLPIAVMGLYAHEFDYKKSFSDKELQHMVLGADYVMRHELKRSGGGFIERIVDIFDANISRFELIKTVKTPWGGISIYGKKKFKENV